MELFQILTESTFIVHVLHVLAVRRAPGIVYLLEEDLVRCSRLCWACKAQDRSSTAFRLFEKLDICCRAELLRWCLRRCPMTWSSAYDVQVDPSLDTERHRFSKFRLRGRDETHCRLVFLPFYGTYINMREGMNSVFKHPGTLKGDVWTGELYRILACMILDSLMRAWCIFLHFCPGGSCCRSHHWWRILRHPADLCHTFPVPESACTECKRNSDFWKVVGQFRFSFGTASSEYLCQQWAECLMGHLTPLHCIVPEDLHHETKNSFEGPFGKRALPRLSHSTHTWPWLNSLGAIMIIIRRHLKIGRVAGVDRITIPKQLPHPYRYRNGTGFTSDDQWAPEPSPSMAPGQLKKR